MDEQTATIDWSPLANLKNHVDGTFTKPAKMYVECGDVINDVVMAINPAQACAIAFQRYVQKIAEAQMADGKTCGAIPLALEPYFWVSLSGTSKTYAGLGIDILDMDIVKAEKKDAKTAHTDDWKIASKTIVELVMKNFGKPPENEMEFPEEC